MPLENVENMPKEGNIFTWSRPHGDQTVAILGHVQWIGFNLDRTTRQFEQLYGNVAALTTPEGRAERYRQMRAARLEMTGIAMQTQSIRQTFTGIYARLTIAPGDFLGGLGAESPATDSSCNSRPWRKSSSSWGSVCKPWPTA